MAIQLTLAEMETLILFNRADPLAVVFTHDAAWIRHLTALGVDGEQQGEAMRFELPKSWIVKPRKRRKRDLTDEQRAELGERMRQVRPRRG